MMKSLLVKPNQADESGCLHKITPQSADWDYVGFELFELKKGQELSQNTELQEACIVIVSGKATVSAEGNVWSQLGARNNPFERIPPDAVYVGKGQEFSVIAESNLEVAITKSKGKSNRPARLIESSSLQYVQRGEGTNTRFVCNILFGSDDADSLLVVEVITPSGNWSSYPPHKHDTDDGEHESALEETYYHRLNPSQGFVFQRVYTDDLSINETVSANDKDVVLVPKGYHPVGVPHGYESYYLNVMAGPERRWVFKNDPQHEWMLT